MRKLEGYEQDLAGGKRPYPCTVLTERGWTAVRSMSRSVFARHKGEMVKPTRLI